MKNSIKKNIFSRVWGVLRNANNALLKFLAPSDVDSGDIKQYKRSMNAIKDVLKSVDKDGMLDHDVLAYAIVEAVLEEMQELNDKC